MATKFGDVFRPVSDLLSNNYSYSNKVEIKSKASNGVTFTTDATLNGSKGAKANLKAAFAVDNLKVDKLAIGTDKVVTAEMSLSGYIPNTKMTFKASDGARAAKDSYGKIGMVYTQAPAVFTAEVDAINGPTVDSSLCFNYEGFMLGASAKANTNLNGDKPGAGFELKDYSAVAGFKTGDFTAAVKATKMLTQLDVGFHHKVDATFSTAGTVKFALDRAATDKAFAVEFGGTYRLDATANIGAKVDSEGKVSAFYKQELCKFADVSLAAQLNVADPASDDHKFGVSLKMHN